MIWDWVGGWVGGWVGDRPEPRQPDQASTPHPGVGVGGWVEETRRRFQCGVLRTWWVGGWAAAAGPGTPPHTHTPEIPVRHAMIWDWVG